MKSFVVVNKHNDSQAQIKGHPSVLGLCLPTRHPNTGRPSLNTEVTRDRGGSRGCGGGPASAV